MSSRFDSDFEDFGDLPEPARYPVACWDPRHWVIKPASGRTVVRMSRLALLVGVPMILGPISLLPVAKSWAKGETWQLTLIVLALIAFLLGTVMWVTWLWNAAAAPRFVIDRAQGCCWIRRFPHLSRGRRVELARFRCVRLRRAGFRHDLEEAPPKKRYELSVVWNGVPPEQAAILATTFPAHAADLGERIAAALGCRFRGVEARAAWIHDGPIGRQARDYV